MRINSAWLSLWLLLTGSGVHAVAEEQPAARMEQIIQSYVDTKRFMGAVLVSKDDKILLDKGYGTADVEWDIPNTPQSKFRLGSITKQFTAASILILEDRGKLKITDPLKLHVPDIPNAWRDITLFNLLTHSSGIFNVTELADYRTFKRRAMRPKDELDLIRNKPLNFKPGEKFEYSNSNYIILGMVIEKVSGQSYSQFLQDNIFTPLGMKDSGYDIGQAVIANRAHGYERKADGTLENADYIDMSVPFAAGSLYSTTHDLLTWEKALFGGKVLSSNSLRKMTTPFKGNYGLGLGIASKDGHREISHNGGIDGFTSILIAYPDDDLIVVALNNIVTGATGDIGHKLADLALNKAVVLASERKEVPVDPKVLAGYVGRYRISPAETLEITQEGGSLFGQLTSQPKFQLFAESDRDFFLKVVDAQVGFVSDESVQAGSLVLHQNGQSIIGKRIDESALPERIRSNTPNPGTGLSLRRYIESLEQGQPDYNDMTPALADAVRRQLPAIEAMIKKWGALRSITFKSVGAQGEDQYDVLFEHGQAEWVMGPLTADGKAQSRSFYEIQGN